MNAVTRKVLDWLPDYDISEFGEVRRITPVKRKTPVPYVLKNTFSCGYFYVNAVLPCGKVRKTAVHRLVCEAFNGEPSGDATHVAHKDGNGRNNAAQNLRWSTPKENCADKILHGTHQAGERVGNHKLKSEQVAEIRKRFTGAIGEQSNFAIEYGVNVATIHCIVRNKTWIGA